MQLTARELMHPARNGERFCAADQQPWLECCEKASVSHVQTAAQYTAGEALDISGGEISAILYLGLKTY